MPANWSISQKVLQLKGDMSYRAMEKAIKEKTGKRIAFGTLRQIACGINRGSIDTIAILAEYADKPLSWFYEEDGEWIDVVDAVRAKYLTPTGNVHEDKRRCQLLELFERRFSSVSDSQLEAYIRALDNLIELAGKAARADEEDEKK